MEAILVLLGIGVLVSLVIPWITLFQQSATNNEIFHLKRKLRILEQAVIELKTSETKIETPPPVSEPPKVQKEPKPEPEPKVEQHVKQPKHIAAKIPPRTDWIRYARSSFEDNLATKLPVWIGSVCLILAAFFLVKYSIELGWMKPIVRVSLGALFGGALLYAGQWVLKKPSIANAERISQGLVGAGLVALYVSIYAALHLYALIPPLLGFGAMATVTVLAVILSLRHGQPIAVFALIGGLLTPMLIGSDEPNAIGMFGYLFVLFTGMFYVLANKGWWVLALLSVIGVFAWSGLWLLLTFSSSDAFILVLFAIAIAGVVASITGRHIVNETVKEDDANIVHGINFAAMSGGIITILWLNFKITLTLFDWSMLGLFSLALIALSYFQPRIYQKPLFAKLGVSLLLFWLWAQDVPLTNAIAVIIGMSAVYIGCGAYMMRKATDPRFWAQLQSVAVLGIFLISYFTLKLPATFTDSFPMFWGIVSLILASLSIYQVADIKRNYSGHDNIKNSLCAIFSFLASSLISIGLAIELPFAYLPLALAAQTLATALIYRSTRIYALEYVCVILTTIFVVLNLKTVEMFTELSMSSLIAESPNKYQIADNVLNMPLIKLGLAALFFGLSFQSFWKDKNKNEFLDHVLFGITILLAGACAYLSSGYVFHGDFLTAIQTHAGFFERAFNTGLTIVIGLAVLISVNKLDVDHLKPWAFGILAIALFRYAYFDLLLLNPYWNNDQLVGSIPVFNGVTLVYGGTALLFTFALYNKTILNNQTRTNVIMALSFVSLFTFSSLTVRQVFHGSNLEDGVMSAAELYGYSIAWLLTGVGLLALGITKEHKIIRMGSLAFIIIAVIKAFIFDVSELEGLYRVFSFLGLGICLIGLSSFYTKFVFKKETVKSQKDS